ncbi:MAG: VanZ family protein [Microbacteriaceae bacterium]
MRARGWRVSGLVCGVLVVGILLTTLTPTPVDRPYRTLVGALVAAVRRLPGLGWFDYDWLESIANALMFVPLGAALTLLVHRWWIAVLCCAALSGAVELGQAAFLPERTASILDVAANTAGALLGAVATALVRRPAGEHRGAP